MTGHKHNITNYQIDHLQFAQYSCNSAKEDQWFVICGGWGNTEANICSLVLKKQTFKDWQLLHGKKHANLNEIRCQNGVNLLSFLSSDNSKLFIIRPWNGRYNVYLFDKDEWLLNAKYTNNIFKFKDVGQRALFLSDRIVILSFETYLHFYDLHNIHDPVKIKSYQIKTHIPNQSNKGYTHHGMCLINFKYLTNDSASPTNQIYVSFILFGGKGNIPFQSSMIEFEVIFDLTNEKKSYKIESINETRIFKISLAKVGRNLLQLCQFNCHCVWNSQKQPIIVIIGGWAEDVYETGDSIFLYNFETNELSEIKKVEHKIIHSHLLKSVF